MTAFLLDTNVLLRLVDRGAPEHPAIRAAVARVLAAGDEIHVAPQVLIELWVVATRPTAVNGLGWDPPVVEAAIQGLLQQLPLLTEGPAVFTIWLRLVSAGVRGKRAHDARLAAVALANAISQIITLNVADFAGMAGVTPVHPRSL